MNDIKIIKNKKNDIFQKYFVWGNGNFDFPNLLKKNYNDTRKTLHMYLKFNFLWKICIQYWVLPLEQSFCCK